MTPFLYQVSEASCHYKTAKHSQRIIVGISAPNRSDFGDTELPKCSFRMDWPAGFGALAIIVNPPPVTAPATTAYLRLSVNPGTRVLRYVIAALSLKAVSIVAPAINVTSFRLPSTGAIHQACTPPVDDKSRKKEANKNRRLQKNAVLILRRNLRESQKEE